MGTPEIWKEPLSAPHLLVSNLGRVKVKTRTRTMPRGGFAVIRGKPTFGCLDDDGRYRFRSHQAKRTYIVARLICEAFNGPPPDGKGVCMHLDEDARNNRADNLAWGTQKENLNAPGYRRHRRLVSAAQAKRGADHHNTTLTESEAMEILISSEPARQKAKRFGVSVSTVRNIQSGRTWSHLQGRGIRS